MTAEALTMGRKFLLLVVTSVLFFGAIIGVLVSLSIPEEKEERVTHLTYAIEGSFDHEAYKKTEPEVKTNPKYFTKIIDSIDVHYSYRFLPEEPVTNVTADVVITAVVGCLGSWEKEVDLVPRAAKGGNFTISFPLDTAALLQMVQDISADVGVTGCSPRTTLKAAVHTVAQTEAGVIEDDFVQTAAVRLGGPTVEWDSDLALSQIGYSQGLKYEQQGNFSYVITLIPNMLYDAATLEPEIPLPSVPVAMRPGESYRSETIDRIDGTFSYKFASSEALQEVIDEVEVTAVVGNPEGRQETFVLVPKSQQTGDFSITFSLDVPLFYAVIKSIEEETGTSSRALTVTADVHTMAQSEFGPIDETFSQSLIVNLASDEVLWPEATTETKEGSIEETLVVSNPTAGTAKMGSLGALGMMSMALLFAVWRYWEFKTKWISRIEADALLVSSKHQDLVVDVEKLPDIRKNEMVVELASLGELIKGADGLLKPVLRLAEPERHIYCVIDGTTRYQYVSLRHKYVSLAKAQAPPEPKPPPTDETEST